MGIFNQVLNAGVSSNMFFRETKDEDYKHFQNVMTVNFWGYVHTTRHALPHLRASKGGIVVISSEAGMFTFI
jgi:NAD(P)-dependent dehydrogenase (short-subunit alcohol dehydrogenase family)